jgi:hypothetical protein
MAENPTHLETHRGKTKELRTAASAPTDPTPESGDIFVNSTSGSETVGIRTQSGWVYVSLADA